MTVFLRRLAYAVSALLIISVVALIQENGSFIRSYVATHVGSSSSLPLDRWMESCGFELYPNLKWQTVMSYHGSNRPVMTVFLPFAVENNWAIWDSPDVDDSDFHGCPTSCVWIRNRDTSMQGLRRNAQCAAQAHAVLFWLPLGFPFITGQAEDVEVIKTSGLIHRKNQIWVGVGTEPDMMFSKRGDPKFSNANFELFSLSISALFNVTISYERTSPVQYPFYIRSYEHYAHADILPWESRQFNVSLLQSNCNANFKNRFEL
jgi:hypothetical protein